MDRNNVPVPEHRSYVAHEVLIAEGYVHSKATVALCDVSHPLICVLHAYKPMRHPPVASVEYYYITYTEIADGLRNNGCYIARQ